VPPMHYGTVIVADTFEHMLARYHALAKVRDFLRGKRPLLVRSLPTVRHVSVLVNLGLRGNWHYQPAGILDDTHLRLFTRRSALRLLGGSGYTPVACRRHGTGPFARLLERAFSSGGEFLLSQMLLAARPLPLLQLESL
jgi:hypothetical protein